MSLDDCRRTPVSLGLAIILAVAIALVVRAPFFLNSDFVLNDGALFLRMSQAIAENGFGLPTHVEYNGENIPFAYPPLAFLLSAALHAITGLDLFRILNFLPLVLNLACVALFPLFVFSLTRNRGLTLLSGIIFPLIPKSYEWLIMGGGLTRSTGFLFMLLATLTATKWLARRRPRELFLTSALLALTGVSHLEWGITAAVTVTLLTLMKGFSPKLWGELVLLGGIALLLSSPWWGWVLAVHGLAPFQAAAHTAEWAVPGVEKPLLAWRAIPGPLKLPMALALGLGAFSTLRTRQWFLPLWLAAIFVTTPRHGPTAAAMPLAMLAAAGILSGAHMLARCYGRYFSSQSIPVDAVARRELGQSTLAMMLMAGCGILAAVVVAANRQKLQHQLPALGSLNRYERAGMRWIGDHTPLNAGFLVLSPTHSWQEDRVAEWFPVLAKRRSLTTAQGLEWLPAGVFAQRVQRIRALKELQHSTSGVELTRELDRESVGVTYVAVFCDERSPTYKAMMGSEKFFVAYKNKGMTLFQKIRIAQGAL